MGSGADFTRKVARQEALKSLQHYFAKDACKTCCCQMAKLDGSKTKGTLVSGQVVDIQPVGLPGQYAMTCPLHKEKSVASKPEPIQIGLDGDNNKCFIAAKETAYSIIGQPVVDTKSNKTISQLTQSPFYLRQIGQSTESDAKKYKIPIDLLDPRIDPETIQVKISADGLALLIGGFFQDHPPEALWLDQVSQGSGGCQGNCTAIDGYDYHTYAAWAVYAGISLDSSLPTGSNITFISGFAGLKDITEECFNKITAPQTKALGSSSVFRLFPTLSDVQGLNNSQVLNDGGPRVDLLGNPVDARFFPNIHDSYTWFATPFDRIEVYSGGSAHYYLDSLTGTGDFVTTWSNDGNNNPLFLNHNNTALAITDSNLIYSFNGDGTIYTVDIIGDISYATIYKVDKADVTMSGNARERSISGDESYPSTYEADCNYYQKTVNEMTYTYQSLYPYLAIFYNSFFDINSLVGSSIQYKLYQPYGPRQHMYKSFGTRTSTYYQYGDNGYEPVTQITTETNTSSLTSCGIVHSEQFPNPNNDEITNWTFEGQSAGVCSGCDLSNASNYLFLVTGDVHTVEVWDGSSITIIDDPNTPTFGVDCFIPHLGLGYCSDVFEDYGCCSEFFYGHINDPTYVQNYTLNLLGFLNAYRYGRGIVSFDDIMKITKVSEDTYQASSSYPGPRIQISRLSSHSNQNHVLGAFRSTTGEKACVYECADPFVPETVYGLTGLTQYIDDFAAGLRGEENAFFDALFNGENVLQDLPTNRFNTANSETRPSDSGFCRYFWANPYVSIGNNIAIPSNDVLPPDVFTDKILSAFGTFPIFVEDNQVFGIATTPPADWNLYYPKLEPENPPATTLNLQFPCNQLKGVDSYIVNGYRRENVQRIHPITGFLTSIETIVISEYNIAKDGNTSFGKTIIDQSTSSKSAEKILDYIITITI